MTSPLCIRLLPALTLCALLVTVGCDSFSFLANRVKSTRVYETSLASPSARKLSASTHNGYIKVTGADTAECSLTATITASAGSDEKAARLAADTSVTLLPSDDAVTVKITKPDLSRGESVTVDLDISVPEDSPVEISSHNGALSAEKVASLKASTHNGSVSAFAIAGDASLSSHNGRISATDVSGHVSASSHNGAVTCENISGTVSVETHNGRITVTRPSSTVTAKSHNGRITLRTLLSDVHVENHNASITASYSPDAPPAPKIEIYTRNGPVTLTPPPDFSATVSVTSARAAVTSEIPLEVEGNITAGRTLKGKIGSGEGSLTIKTSNGRVKIIKGTRDTDSSDPGADDSPSDSPDSEADSPNTDSADALEVSPDSPETDSPDSPESHD